MPIYFLLNQMRYTTCIKRVEINKALAAETVLEGLPPMPGIAELRIEICTHDEFAERLTPYSD